MSEPSEDRITSLLPGRSVSRCCKEIERLTEHWTIVCTSGADDEYGIDRLWDVRFCPWCGQALEGEG